MGWIKPCSIDKISKWFTFHELVNGGGTDSIVVKILKVHFEEVYLLLYLLKDNFIVPVIFSLLKDSDKEELIESSNLIDIDE